MVKVLGIETSCDETAAAVVEGGKHILSSVVASQVEIHARYGGIVPEVASRQHLLTIPPALDQPLKGAGGGLAGPGQGRPAPGLGLPRGPGRREARPGRDAPPPLAPGLAPGELRLLLLRAQDRPAPPPGRGGPPFRPG